MSNFAEFFLSSVFLLCSFAAVFSLLSLRLEVKRAGKALLWAKRAVLAASGLSVVVLILLVAAFLRDDFSIAIVSQYSSAGLAFFYKLSAVWASSSGSLLLWWVGVLVLFSLWSVKSKITELMFEAVALAIGASVCLGFSALLLFVAKPFANSPVTIDDGAGLNPLLQNFWMIIHPPLLFVGYSFFLIPFVVILAGVLVRRAESSCVYVGLRGWLLAGICFLGAGIATGARWSYIELGWGGYWAWDPVENASLLPWLAAIAALHSLAGMRIADKFRLWTVALAPVPFIFCLVAAFITRSGILQSVHAFDHNTVFLALLVFIACCSLLWIICIVRAVKTIFISSSQMSAFSLDKSEILFWTNIIFIFTVTVIAVATFWPILSRVVAGSNSSFVLTRPFYDRVISGIGILLAFLVGLGALADLQKRSGFVLQLLGCCAAGLICFGLVFNLGGIALLMRLACGICAFSFVAVLTRLWLNLKVGGKIGGDIAHLGLLFLVVAAGIASSERTIQTLLAKGEKIALGDYTIVYDSLARKSFDDVAKVGPEIVVEKKGLTKKLWPHNDLYPDGQSTAEVAVYTGLFEDVYLSFDGLGQDDRVIITAKLKPLMSWLWFAVLLIVGGVALAMFEGKKAGKLKLN
jgi:cytochrome c-type biogenesis protein CcmF